MTFKGGIRVFAPIAVYQLGAFRNEAGRHRPPRVRDERHGAKPGALAEEEGPTTLDSCSLAAWARPGDSVAPSAPFGYRADPAIAGKVEGPGVEAPESSSIQERPSKRCATERPEGNVAPWT